VAKKKNSGMYHRNSASRAPYKSLAAASAKNGGNMAGIIGGILCYSSS